MTPGTMKKPSDPRLHDPFAAHAAKSSPSLRMVCVLHFIRPDEDSPRMIAKLRNHRHRASYLVISLDTSDGAIRWSAVPRSELSAAVRRMLLFHVLVCDIVLRQCLRIGATTIAGVGFMAMTLAIVCKGPEGLVLAADSRITLTTTLSDTKETFVANFDNATKLFGIDKHPNVGILTHGNNVIGATSPRGIHGFMGEFETLLNKNANVSNRSQPKATNRSQTKVVDIARKLGKFYDENWKNGAMRQLHILHSLWPVSMRMRHMAGSMRFRFLIALSQSNNLLAPTSVFDGVGSPNLSTD